MTEMNVQQIEELFPWLLPAFEDDPCSVLDTPFN